MNIRNGDFVFFIDFNIRGFEFINGGSLLVLVDGVLMDFNKLNFNDIVNISVLKDVLVVVVYGVCVVFGVILVEMKKGWEGKMRFIFGMEFVVFKLIMFIDFVNDFYEYVKVRDLVMYCINGIGFD